jgi:hypothetical protein
MLNKLPVSTIAELSNLSKSYIRALEQASPGRNNGKTHDDTGRAIELFLQSRPEGTSKGVYEFYHKTV